MPPHPAPRRVRGLVLTSAAVLSIHLVGARLAQGQNGAHAWKAPPRAANTRNPIPPDDRSLAAGKTLYAKECAACHGDTGKGNGPDAAELSLQPPDFSAPSVSDQSDGELFWKMTEGRKPMPRYGRLLHDDDRWNLVNYIRSLAPRAHG